MQREVICTMWTRKSFWNKCRAKQYCMKLLTAPLCKKWFAESPWSIPLSKCCIYSFCSEQQQPQKFWTIDVCCTRLHFSDKAFLLIVILDISFRQWHGGFRVISLFSRSLIQFQKCGTFCPLLFLTNVTSFAYSSSLESSITIIHNARPAWLCESIKHNLGKNLERNDL